MEVEIKFNTKYLELIPGILEVVTEQIAQGEWSPENEDGFLMNKYNNIKYDVPGIELGKFRIKEDQ
jgi:hypothetical protein